MKILFFSAQTFRISRLDSRREKRSLRFSTTRNELTQQNNGKRSKFRNKFVILFPQPREKMSNIRKGRVDSDAKTETSSHSSTTADSKASSEISLSNAKAVIHDPKVCSIFVSRVYARLLTTFCLLDFI
jgi:hypothetical protein